MAKILVADDDEEIRKVISSILTQQGLEVIQAADGDTVLESAVSESPDLILLDILMPGMSGFDVLRNLKESSSTKAIPVIVVSGLSAAEDENRAMKAGALDYIAKPWAPGELEDRIQIALPELDISQGVGAGAANKSDTTAEDALEQRRLRALSDTGNSPPVAISTGSDPIDKALLGGLPLGSFTLLEGATGTGKSVMCQHLAYGALMAEQGVAYYVQSASPEDLAGGMKVLGLDVSQNLNEGQMLIYPLEEFYGKGKDSGSGLDKLLKHLHDLPWDMSVIVIDALTHMVNRAGSNDSLSFLVECKALCRLEKTIVVCLHTSSFDPELLGRLNSLFGTHLSFRVEGFTQGLQMKSMNVMEVAKVKEASRDRNNSVYFEVDPDLGKSMNMSLKVLPMFRVKG